MRIRASMWAEAKILSRYVSCQSLVKSLNELE